MADKPIVDEIIVVDATTCFDTYGSYVKGLSRLQIRIIAMFDEDSPIVGYKTKVNGEIHTSGDFTTGILKSSGEVSISAIITDNKNRTSDVGNGTITVLDYSRPSISKLTVHRCDSKGNEDEKGGWVKVTFSANVTSLNDKNTATYILSYKKSSESTYVDNTLKDLNNQYSVNDYSYIFRADTSSSYDVKLLVKDNHYSTTRTTSASTAFVLMHFNANGTGIAFGVPIYDDHGNFISVTEGASGIWSYKKMSNGDVEMWGSYEVADVACTTELGGMYRSAVIIPDSFPFDVHYPNVVASYETDGYGAILWATTMATTTDPSNYYLLRPTSGTITSGKINFHVRGKWTT